MIMEHKYKVEVTRDGRWWSVYVPEIDYHTQARTVTEIEEMALDLIVGATGKVPADIRLDVNIVTPHDVADELSNADRLDNDGRQALSSAASKRRAAATRLHKHYGLSVIDTAKVLGVTRARAYQLLGEAKSTKTKLAAA